MILSKHCFISIYRDIPLQTCAHCGHEFQKTEFWNKMTCSRCHEDTCYLCHGVRQTSPLISMHCSQAVADISAHFYGQGGAPTREKPCGLWVQCGPNWVSGWGKLGRLRHAAYKSTALFLRGKMGRGNRLVIPSCCIRKIRELCPNPPGIPYIGHKD
jgi:hypothetical protein